MREIARMVHALQDTAGKPAALATLVTIEGSSYRRPGARLLLLADGGRIGSISGGCLEEDVLARCQRVLASGEPELAVYDTTAENDLVWGVGLGCQGVVRIFIERVPPVRPDWVATVAENLCFRRNTCVETGFAGTAPKGTRLAGESAEEAGVFRTTVVASPALVVCGAGDDAQPLVRLAKETGWHVTVADPRPAYATAERFPAADRVLVATGPELVERLSLDERTFVVVMTHRYVDDREFLRALLPRDFPYLGQLGPRVRTERLLAELAMPEALRAKLHAPVGLDLGGNEPETVALAIMAEMQARLNARTPGFLRDRPGPIHA
jgi:xanthine dehydrogenase accessory factor